MNKIGPSPRLSAGGPRTTFPLLLSWFPWLTLLVLLLGATTLQAVEDPESQYLQILSVIDQAETLQKTGKPDLAKAKYQQAQRGLFNLKQNHPVFSPKIVGFRLKDVTAKIDALSKPPPGTETTEPSDAEVKPGGITSGSSAQVRLLDAGAEPRRTLRIHAKPGDRQKVVMTMKMAMNMEMGGMPAQAVKMPGLTMKMELVVKEVSPEGDITYETILGDASVAEEEGVMPQVADAIKASFASLKGFTGAGTISSRGTAKGTEKKLPGSTNPQMRQALEQMHDSFAALTSGFPEEAVGPGAKWEVKLPLKTQGMTIMQTTTCELISMEEDTLNLKNSLVQNAANQKIENPSMPGLKMDLNKLTGTGTGDATINLNQILPSKATMNTKSDMAMSMNMAGQKQTMTMKMDINLKFETE